MYLFILGRQPEIGIAELNAVFGNAELLLPNVALVSSDVEPDIDRLGGAKKVGHVIYNSNGKPGDFLLDKFKGLPDGKITLGVSHYGKTASTKTATATGLFLKKRLDRSIRILPNASAEISDAATLGNKLGTSANKIELLMAYVGHLLIIAELIGVQDLNSYTLRDRGRPKRDARVGMLPPKLAQIMINLAVGAKKSGVLLDSFCGTGVVLQEAALLGFDIYGTDIEPRMIEYTEQNLEWLRRKLGVDFRGEITVGDATNFDWGKRIDFVATETYLGRPYATEPSNENLNENIANCKIILTKFLKNLHRQTTESTGICLAVPCWFVGNRTIHLRIIKDLEKLGYKQIHQSDNKKPLIYHREGQIVGRELLVLRKK